MPRLPDVGLKAQGKAHGRSRALPSTSFSSGMPKVEGAHNRDVPDKPTLSLSSNKIRKMSPDKTVNWDRMPITKAVSAADTLATLHGAGLAGFGTNGKGGKGGAKGWMLGRKSFKHIGGSGGEKSGLRSGLARLASEVDGVVNRSLFFHWARDNTQDDDPNDTPFDPLKPPDPTALPSIIKPVTMPLRRSKKLSPAKSHNGLAMVDRLSRSDGGHPSRNGSSSAPGGGGGSGGGNNMSDPKTEPLIPLARKRRQKASDLSPKLMTNLDVSEFLRESAEMAFQLPTSDRPRFGYSLSKTGPKLPSRRRFAALEWCCIATKASVDDVRLTKMIWYMLANLHRVPDEPIPEIAAKSCMSQLRIESGRSMRLYTERIKDMLQLKDQHKEQLSHLGSSYWRHALRQEKVVAALTPKAIHEYYRWRAAEMLKMQTHTDAIAAIANAHTHSHLDEDKPVDKPGVGPSLSTLLAFRRISCIPGEPLDDPNDLSTDVNMEPILSVTVRMLSVLLQKPFRAEVLKLTTNSEVRHKMPQAKSLRQIALARSLASTNQLGSHTADLHGRFPADSLCASLIFKSSAALQKLFSALQNNPNLEIKAVINTLNGSKNERTVQEEVIRDFPCMTCQCIFTAVRSDKPLSLKYKDIVHTPKFSQIRAQVAVEQQAAGYSREEARDHVAQAAGLLAGSGLAKQPLKIAVQLELYLEVDYKLYTESRLCRTVLGHTNLDELCEDLFLIRETYGK